ncbi:MAG: hypothetical protein U0237_19670 [Thermoleophilia bacterium]
MTSPQTDPPFIARIRGPVARDAADDLVSDLMGQGWECSPARRAKHADPEFIVALAGLTAAAATRLLRALPATLDAWGRRHRLREYVVIVERGGEEVTRITVVTDSDADSAETLLAEVSGSAGAGAEDRT